MTDPELDNIYRHALGNRKEVERSALCGCVSCGKLFPATEVVDYVDAGLTALCPECGIDAIVGDASGVELTAELLAELNKRYF